MANRAPFKTTAPRLEQLEVRNLMAVLAESEPNNTKPSADAVVISTAAPSVDITGRISSKNDEDFFRLTSPTSGRVQLNVNSGAGLSGRVSVEDRLGKKLLETEPRDGVNAGSFSIQAGQDVFLRVRGHSHGLVGNYTVVLNLTAPATQPGGGGTGGNTGGTNPVPSTVLTETEFNGTRATANTAALDSSGALRIKGTATTDRDEDYFVFRPTQSGRLNLNVSSTGAAAKLEVQDQFGRTLFETEPKDGKNSGSVQVTAGQTYFLRLRSAAKVSSAYLVDLAFSSGV